MTYVSRCCLVQVRAWGYEPLLVSCERGTGLAEVSEVLSGRVSVVAGPSGERGKDSRQARVFSCFQQWWGCTSGKCGRVSVVVGRGGRPSGKGSGQKAGSSSQVASMQGGVRFLTVRRAHHEGAGATGAVTP